MSATQEPTVKGNKVAVLLISLHDVGVTVTPCRVVVHCTSNFPRATEQAMSRQSKGESGVMGAWLETSVTGLRALVGRIQV